MIHIETPVGCTAELGNVLAVIFSEWFGLAYRLSQSEREDICLTCAELSGEIRLPDAFFGQFHRQPDAWLTAASLPELPLATWDSRELAAEILLTNPRVPVLFGESPRDQVKPLTRRKLLLDRVVRP